MAPSMRRACFLLGALLVLSCRTEEPAPSETPVFIIAIDTLRSDRLGSYGNRDGLTPAMDAFRADAILFEHAFSAVPLTLPSHATLFTGRIPPAHKVRDNGGYTLPSDIPTLAGLLKSRGYETGAAVSSYVLRRTTGINAGFDFFDDSLPAGAEERPGDESRQALSTWIAARGSRVFGFLHLFEPHTPYVESYDAEVARADAVVGRFLDDLRKRGLYDRALIVVLSDHGEGLGDHGEDEHGVFLYREVIQVPLMIKLPARLRAGESVASTAGLVDVLPTVLAALAIDPPPSLDGRDLFAPAPARTSIYGETWFPRLHLGWNESFSMIDDVNHYIEAPRPELFRYRTDRSERANVIAEERRAAAAMRSTLGSIDRALNEPSAIDPEEREKLAALGYIGSSASSQGSLPDAKDRIAFLRELKRAFAANQAGDHQAVIRITRPLTEQVPELVDAWSLLTGSLLARKETGPALKVLEAAARRHPEHADLRLTWARTLFARGENEKARWQLELVLTRSPDHVPALLLAAQMDSQDRQFSSALRRLERAQAVLEGNSRPPVRELHYRKGEALLELRRVAEAQQEFARETVIFPDHLEAWGALAVTHWAQGRKDEARAVLRTMIARNPNSPRAEKLAAETLSVLER
jgi:choline-sulfatase